MNAEHEWRFDYPMLVSDRAHIDVAQVLYSGDEAMDRATGAMLAQRLNDYDTMRASHDALVAALQQVANLSKYGDGHDECEPDGEDAMRVLNWHIDNARAALAQLKP